MNETLRWGLPMLAMGQAQKEITHNEAVLAIDRWLYVAATNRTENEPPMTAVAGQTYIIGAAAAGEWSEKGGQLAFYDGFGWIYMSPRDGCLAWVLAEITLFVFSAGEWFPVFMLPATGAVDVYSPAASL